ncbi:MAG: exonuclease [Flavobacteriaceae bacterium]|nr:exonuclease [Flavobacteriaceae bacterium]
MYAIVDIETTGGKYNEEGITEIAIYKHDGKRVVDQFISLINPKRPIQPYVANLTGISNKMLRSAPKFFEVAKRIVEITENCVLVAHNAKFDYRILSLEFERLGFKFERKNLCTVELSKHLIPDLPSYSLGKLVRSLGIPMSDRHRASGDAIATTKLFELLLNKDLDKQIVKASIRMEPKRQLEPKLVAIINSISSVTGVYYMHNEAGDIIYIGKSKNIKSRINQHFAGQNSKSKKIQLEVSAVTFEETGSELLALLKESAEIKHHKPKFNRALRRTIFTHGLFSFKDENGYINLKIQKIKENQKPITTFANIQSGKSFINKIVKKYSLCQKLCGLYKTKSSCFGHTIKECEGACVGEELVEEYNIKVNKIIKYYSFITKSFLLIDKGRNLDERSAVWVENGVLRGYAYFNLNFQISNIDVLSSLVTPLEHNKDAQHILQSYMRRHKSLKVIDLED